MKNRLVISYDSSQCTGKTTLINALKRKYDIFNIQREPVRNILKDKEKVNFADDNIQLRILNNQRSYILENNYILQDRSPLSSYCYTSYLRSKNKTNIEDDIFDFIEEESKIIMQSKLIDYVVVLPIEFEMIDDGFRTVDKQQQKDIQDLIDDTIKKWGIEYKVLRPSGTVEERVAFLSKIIDGYLLRDTE